MASELVNQRWGCAPAHHKYTDQHTWSFVSEISVTWHTSWIKSRAEFLPLLQANSSASPRRFQRIALSAILSSPDPALMAQSLTKAAPLKPEIKLAQALSEFEAILSDDQKAKLHTYRGQSPPNPADVMRFTAEIDSDASRNRKSRQCVGTRLTNVLNAVQQFSTIVDFIVGNSQSQIAGAIWGTVKISLQLNAILFWRTGSDADSWFGRWLLLFQLISINYRRCSCELVFRVQGIRISGCCILNQ